MRVLKNLVRMLLTTAAACTAIVIALIAKPEPLFAYSVTHGRITVFSDEPISFSAAKAVIEDVEGRLAASPLNTAGGRYNVFTANSAWRRSLFFNYSWQAGGVAYYPISASNVFLSGAHFGRGRLVASAGHEVGGVRTLSYFIAHEITHLQTGARVGTARLLSMPVWIREGIADFAALGPPDDVPAMARAVASDPQDVAHWNQFGFYSKFRLPVSYFLGRGGLNSDRLLNSNMDHEKALRMASEALREGS